jgi:hypothetical protein
MSNQCRVVGSIGRMIVPSVTLGTWLVMVSLELRVVYGVSINEVRDLV